MSEQSQSQSAPSQQRAQSAQRSASRGRAERADTDFAGRTGVHGGRTNITSHDQLRRVLTNCSVGQQIVVGWHDGTTQYVWKGVITGFKNATTDATGQKQVTAEVTWLSDNPNLSTMLNVRPGASAIAPLPYAGVSYLFFEAIPVVATADVADKHKPVQAERLDKHEIDSHDDDAGPAPTAPLGGGNASGVGNFSAADMINAFASLQPRQTRRQHLNGHVMKSSVLPDSVNADQAGTWIEAIRDHGAPAVTRWLIDDATQFGAYPATNASAQRDQTALTQFVRMIEQAGNGVGWQAFRMPAMIQMGNMLMTNYKFAIAANHNLANVAEARRKLTTDMVDHPIDSALAACPPSSKGRGGGGGGGGGGGRGGNRSRSRGRGGGCWNCGQKGHHSSQCTAAPAASSGAPATSGNASSSQRAQIRA